MDESETFQEAVLKLVMRIPKGRVTTYGRIATEIKGSVHAARAVGQALARNPRPGVIPCHRVVRSDGDVGGYSRGIAKKIELLRAEGIEIEGRRVKNINEVLFQFSSFSSVETE